MNKADINRARRAARRQGLRLEKSRARDPGAIDWGFQLRDEATGDVVSCDPSTGRGYGLSLERVERELADRAMARRQAREGGS